MSEQPGSVAEDAPTLWWETTLEGAEVPVALVRIERVHADEEDLDSALRRQARFTAGVEYIARAFGAAEPLVWGSGGTTLVLGGIAAERMPERAYLAAKELWERARIDLDLPVRIGAHVGHVRWRAQTETIAGEDVDICEHLAAAAPAGGVVLSEDVALALRDEDRGDLAALGVTVRDGVPAWVFPAGAALQADAAAFAQSPDRAMWDAFRRYALGPDVSKLRYVGFRLQKNEPPSLDLRDVFVPPQAELHTQRRAAEERTPGRLPSAATPHHAVHREEHGPTQPIAIGDLFTRYRSAVILGDPGSGKTTLIRWLAVVAAGGRFLLGAQLGVHERLLPLPVSVGRLAEVQRSFPDGTATVPAALARYFHDRRVGDERELAAFLSRALEAGRCLVLLDGLDEVRAEERAGIHAWLESLAANVSQNRFVATSRVVGFTGFSIADAALVTLRPFDDVQVERYVRAFTRAYARWELGGDDAGRGESDAEQLLGSLRQNGRLLAIARNPFVLSALALVHRAEGRLPRHRVQAYELFARALCETWAETRRLVAGEPAGTIIAYEEEALPILGALAVAMHRRYPTGVAPKAFVVETLAQALAERRDISGEEAERAANAFLERAGHEVQILLERGAGEWGFLHLTFQEFFAAAGLHALERFEDEAFAHLFDPRWEEVLRLGVGYMALVQKRPEAARRFVQKVLEYEAPEADRWVTSVLKKQVPLAALLAAEAGDALPEGLKRRVAEAFAEWVCDPPSDERAQECTKEIASYDFRCALEKTFADRVRSADRGTRKAAARAFAFLGAVDEVECLFTALDDTDIGVRDAAAWALSKHDPASVRDRLEKAAVDVRAEVRARALGALMHVVDDDRRITVLRVGLADAEWLVRHRVLDAMNAIHFPKRAREDPHIFELVLVATRDASAEVRKDAALFFGQAFYQISIDSDDIRTELISMAEGDPDHEVRIIAAEAVAKTASSQVVHALFALLTDPETEQDADMFDMIADALTDHPLQELVNSRLSAASHSPRIADRVGAAFMLARRGTDATWEQLVNLATDPSATFRASVLFRLHAIIWDQASERGLTQPAIDILIRLALNDESDMVREEALRILSNHVDEKTLAVFVRAVADPSTAVRGVALDVLAECSGPLDEDSRTYQMLSDVELDTREMAAHVIIDRFDPAAVPHLLRASPNTPAAREALWKIAERLHRSDRPADP